MSKAERQNELQYDNKNATSCYGSGWLLRSCQVGFAMWAVLFGVDGNGQSVAPSVNALMANPEANYIEITEGMQQWLDANPGAATDENGPGARFARWEWFWTRRAGCPGQPDGDLSEYMRSFGSLSTLPICDGGAMNPVAWTELGPTQNIPASVANLGIGNCVTAHPSAPNRVYVGCRSSGIWRCDDASAAVPAWTCITDELRVPGLGANDIAIAPSDPYIIYAGTGQGRGGSGFGTGVIYSDDGGDNWWVRSPVQPGANVSIWKVVVHPTNPNLLYVAGGTSVYKSDDSGITWDEVIDVEALFPTIGNDPYASNSPTRFMRQLVMHPGDPNTLYCATNDNLNAITLGLDDGAKIFKTVDAGATWNEILPNGMGGTGTEGITLGVTPAAPGSLWAILGSTYKVSNDGGASWTTITQASNPASVISISPTDAMVQYYAYHYFSYKSINGGQTQINVHNNGIDQHVDCRNIHVVIGSSAGTFGGQDLVYQVNDGGVSRSTDGCQTWQDLNGTGLGIREIYGIGVNEHSGAVGSGQQDNSLSIFDDGLWQQPSMGQDGAMVVGSRKFRELMYGQRWCCNVDGSHDRLYAIKKSGVAWSYLANGQYDPGVSDGYLNIRPMTMKENDHLLMGKFNVHESTEFGFNPFLDLDPISNFGSQFGPNPAWRVRALASAPSDPDRIYVGLTGLTWGDPNAEKFFFRTTTGGGTGAGDWENLSAGLPEQVKCCLSVNCFAVDPYNADRLWAGGGGYHGGGTGAAPYDGSQRVLYSADGGETWTDYSEGLPRLAINDLIYQRGTDDALYAATDVGVFYRHAGMTQWECYNDGLPAMIVSDLDVDYCTRTLYAGSMGRGLWSVPLFDAPAKERVVASDDVWNSHEFLAGNLRILPGATLTVTNTVTCYENVNVFIEPGGRMVVDGGVFTNHCGSFWQGIQVWGNSGQYQYGTYAGSNNPQYQGMLVLKNGARLEHAREAVQTMNPDDWGSTGGILQAHGTQSNPVVFKNCRRSASFIMYENVNQNTGVHYANRSYFRYCDFIIDDDYRGPDDFYAHVSLWRVDGVKFNACDFVNQRSTIIPPADESERLGKGIFSLDAQFKVQGACTQVMPLGQSCPSADWIPGTFVGLDHGIDARNSSTGYNFTVDRCSFENNVCGVYASGVVGFAVRNCDLVLGQRNVTLTGVEDAAFNDSHRGIFSTEGYAFQIDDNTLALDPAPNAPCEGVVVGYTRDHNDIVFRNEASGMTAAFIGEGITSDPANRGVVGLQYICNYNNGNEYNIWNRLITDADPTEYADHTMRLNQGDPDRPAANTFDRDNINLPIHSDLYSNTTLNTVTYHYHAPGTASEPIDVDPNFPAAMATAVPADLCVHKLLGIPGGSPDDVPSVMVPILNGHLATNKTAYGNTRYLYDQLIDGGSTDEVVQEIMSTWPQDAWELRDYLLARSPYLTVEVLKEMVSRNIMPAAMVAEVCIANPDATRQEGFLDWIQLKSGFPLPAYLAGAIVASWEVKTYRTSLEATMGEQHARMTLAANLLLDAWQRDTVNQADSLRGVWQRVRTGAARYGEALVLLQGRDYTMARTVVESIPIERELEPEEEEERQRMLELVSFLEGVALTGRTEAQLNTVELDALEQVVGGKYDRAATWTQNLLCVGYGRCRAAMTGGDGTERRPHYAATAASGVTVGATLLLLPNPATTYCTIRYNLGASAMGSAEVVVTDAVGRVVHRVITKALVGDVLWDLRGQQAGVYSVELREGPRTVKTDRLVVGP